MTRRTRGTHHRVLLFLASLGALVVVAGSGAAGAFASSGPAAEQLGWGTAVPISTRAPAWFNRKLYRRVVAAGPRGVPLSSVRRRPARKGSPGGGGGIGGC